MLTRVVFLLLLSISPLATASSVLPECGPAILLANSVRRNFWDSRLASPQSKFVKELLKGEDAPLQFEVRWFSGKAYLIEPRFNTWMAVNGNALEIAYSDSSDQPLRLQLSLPEQFRNTGFLNYFKSPTKKQRMDFYEWYVSQVGPIVIEQKWKQLTDLMNANAFTWEKWEEMVRLIELFAPQGIVVQSERAPYDKFRLGVFRHKNDSLRISFHLWSPNVVQARFRFSSFFDSWTDPVCDESWKAIDSDDETDIRTTHFESCKLSADLFSISKHRNLFPEDTLSDLLEGLNAGEGGYLLDLYAHFDTIRMQEADQGAIKWKKLLEAAIVKNTLRYAPQN